MALTVFSRRRRRKRWARLFLLCFALVCLAIGLFFGLQYEGGNFSFQRDIPFSYFFRSQFLFAGGIEDLTGLYDHLAPLSESEGESEDSLLAWDVAYDEDELTGEMIPIFISNSSSGGEIADLVQRESPGNLNLVALESDEPRVLIYCTHTAESYAGNEKDADGRGDVLKVAKHLEEVLEETYGIEVLVSENVHDSPDWSRSYACSRETAEELLAQYPNAELMIDLHRDSGPEKADTTMEVNGESAAKLLLVVGSDATMNHPNWRQNWETAKAVGAAIDGVNGDILRAIRVQKGRYNQHLTPNAILLEVGTDQNTLDEAYNGIEVFAEALAKYLDG